jgi:CubicO group peptidase (beta-lactamase class C family)
VDRLQREVDSTAQATGFSGVVRIADVAHAYGLANRAYGIANTVDTQFAIASGTKGLTAVTIATLLEDGALELSTTVRSVLGDDLPLIRDDVTIEHLLSHTSGIGDYYDEEVEHDFDAYVLPVPVHELATTEDYLKVLDGHETKFPPGERFSYCNSGYVVLALVAERVGGVPFHELVQLRVCAPAGMDATAFLRSDELPPTAAIGYVKDGRTNIFHLPVRGSGDGGIYTTVDDMHAFWHALFAGEIVSRELVAELTRRRTEKYGMGFWLEHDTVVLTGADAGVSFHSVHDPARDRAWTVISNTSDGAWPIARLLRDEHGRDAGPR